MHRLDRLLAVGHHRRHLLLQVDDSGGVVVHSAWAGDSRAVLARLQADGTLAAKDLSNDQKPERPDEKARARARAPAPPARPPPPRRVPLPFGRRGSSGRAAWSSPSSTSVGQPAGPMRVWYLAQVAPGLAMSRSIGDAVGAMVGVTAEPELMDTTLKTEDAFLVIASDGVWEFLESQDVVASSAAAKLKGRPPTEETLLMVAQYIADKSRQEWLKEDKYVDDITAIVCLFQQHRRRRRRRGKRRRPPQQYVARRYDGEPAAASRARRAPTRGGGDAAVGRRAGRACR